MKRLWKRVTALALLLAGLFGMVGAAAGVIERRNVIVGGERVTGTVVRVVREYQYPYLIVRVPGNKTVEVTDFRDGVEAGQAVELAYPRGQLDQARQVYPSSNWRQLVLVEGGFLLLSAIGAIMAQNAFSKETNQPRRK